MGLLHQLIDVFLRLDRHLEQATAHYGALTYLILFAIVFCETGLVVTPFLPGDSLLFAAGAIAALGTLSPVWLIVALSAAAVGGDAVNYWVGHLLGRRLVERQKAPRIKPEHLEKTRQFYEKYGVKTIVIARFVPIVRTIAPFVAGLGRMAYGRFSLYNVIGGILWVVVGVLSGYLFGNVPFVKQHFSLVILAIVAVSLLPAVVELLRSRRAPAASPGTAGTSGTPGTPGTP
ncbi:MAG: DedA family protein [Acidobacteriota bacterium]|nr:DedA family protein [Acidobacteriota bacterium]